MNWIVFFKSIGIFLCMICFSNFVSDELSLSLNYEP